VQSEAPYLRVAIWDDGRVLFAKDPARWGHELQEGRIAAYRVAQLKKALPETGVFDLKGTGYLVPDAPEYCLMVDLAEKKQMLYWDEVDMPGYGINVNPKPHHVEFKKCWKAVNNLALVACPDQFEAVKERFKVPASWRLRTAIQSEQSRRERTRECRDGLGSAAAYGLHRRAEQAGKCPGGQAGEPTLGLTGVARKMVDTDKSGAYAVTRFHRGASVSGTRLWALSHDDEQTHGRPGDGLGGLQLHEDRQQHRQDGERLGRGGGAQAH
jgi:hypothetical protein